MELKQEDRDRLCAEAQLWTEEMNGNYGCSLYVDPLGCVRTSVAPVDDDPYTEIAEIDDTQLGEPVCH